MHIVIPFLLTLAVCSTSTAAAAAAAAAATAAVLNSPERSGEDGGVMRNKHEPQPAPKYFHEPGGGLEMGHYDARFFRGKVPYEQHRPVLQHLIRSYLATFRELGIETWLAHGSLLGWWWNGRIMPWDYDLDVQVTVETLRYLAQHLNQTTHEYTVPSPSSSSSGEAATTSTSTSRTYLLDINPHHADARRGNGANVIDARWIDTGNGMFVDITGLAERDPEASPGVWSCKNAHRYRTAELFPTRRTLFEGVPAGVPYAFDAILAAEYGPRSLVATEWAEHRWAPELKEWVRIPKPPPAEDGGGGGAGDSDGTDADERKKQMGGDRSDVVVVFVEETVVKEV